MGTPSRRIFETAPIKTLYSKKKFKTKRKARDGFVTDVLRAKNIMLVGAENGPEPVCNVEIETSEDLVFR